MQIETAFQHRKGRRSSREALIVHVFDRFQLLFDLAGRAASS